MAALYIIAKKLETSKYTVSVATQYTKYHIAFNALFRFLVA